MKAKHKTGITACRITFTKRKAKYTCMAYIRNEGILRQLKILEISEYKTNCIQRVERIQLNTISEVLNLTHCIDQRTGIDPGRDYWTDGGDDNDDDDKFPLAETATALNFTGVISIIYSVALFIYITCESIICKHLYVHSCSTVT
jgi:hypothetical protein